MRIVNAAVSVCSPGRAFVTVRIDTDAGISGLGDATLNGRELAVASYLSEHVLPLLEGRDPMATEALWQYLYRGAYWRRGPVTMAAIGAIDIALWDLKAKALDVPLYQLLGGASREKVRVYGHASAGDLDTLCEAVARYRDMGYEAIRIQCTPPGVEHGYGVGKGDLYYEPATPGPRPAEETWSTAHYLDFAPRMFAHVRDAFGWELHLLHDAHHRLTPQEAAWLGQRLEPHRPFWLEDVAPAELQEGYRLIRRHTTVPLALGEVFNSIYDCRLLLTEQLIDYIRATPSHCGGLSHLLKIAHLAEVHHIRTGCHGPTDVSPVAMAAMFHFDLAIHNFGIQEFMRHTEATNAVFPHAYRFEDGFVHPGDVAGLGVDYDEDLARQHPYTPAYLPVAYLDDGTVHNW